MPRLSSFMPWYRELASVISTNDSVRVKGATLVARFSQSGETQIGAVGPSAQGGVKIDSITILRVTGTPEGALTAPVGSLALRSDGGASTTLYVKETGAGNTGWVAK